MPCLGDMLVPWRVPLSNMITFVFFFHLKSKPGQINNTPASSLHWIPGVSWRNGEVKPRNPPMALMYIYRVGAGMTRGLPLAWWHNLLASTMMPIGVFCMPFVGVQFRFFFLPVLELLNFFDPKLQFDFVFDILQLLFLLIELEKASKMRDALWPFHLFFLTFETYTDMAV